MGEEKPRVEDILKRIDDLIRILKFISEDLAEVSKTLKASLSASTGVQRTISLEQPLSSGTQTIDDVQRVFPQDLVGMLYFEETDEYVLVKPRQYLGSDNFRRIAAIVRDQLGGEYVSAGRDSHFRIPRKS